MHYFIFLDSRWGIRSLFFILYLGKRKTETMRSHVAVFFFFRLLSLTFSFVIRCCMQKTSQLGSARKKKKSILLLSNTTWHTCFIFTIERVGNTLKRRKLKINIEAYLINLMIVAKIYSTIIPIQMYLWNYFFVFKES